MINCCSCAFDTTYISSASGGGSDERGTGRTTMGVGTIAGEEVEAEVAMAGATAVEAKAEVAAAGATVVEAKANVAAAGV